MAAPHDFELASPAQTSYSEGLSSDFKVLFKPASNAYDIVEATTTPLSILNTTDLRNNTTSKFGHYGPLEQYNIFWAARYMNLYYLWVVFAFGFPGNIVSFITILRMKPFTSPTMYVASLAFVDNTCLVCKMLFFLLTKYDAPLGDRGCGALTFLGSLTAMFANWLLVVMTVERCLAICLPLKVGSICTKKLHVGGLLLIVSVLIMVNLQHFWTSEMMDKNGDYYCNPSETYDGFLKVWFWVDAVFYAILPAILLIIMNALIIFGIRRSARIQRELTNKASQVAETMRQQRQITIMLVVVCVAFVVLITPSALFYAIQSHWKFEKHSYEHATYLFTNQLTFVLADSTHAVNFYLYFFSTLRFRKRCLETIFYFCMPRRRARRFRGSTISGMSKNFRLSVTDVTSVPQNAVQLTNFSSPSSVSSNHHIVGNGDTKMTRFKSVRDGSF